VIHGVQVVPVIPSPTEDAIDLGFRFVLKTGAHTGCGGAFSSRTLSSCPSSLTDPLKPIHGLPTDSPVRAIRNHHELALWTLATSDVRQPQGEAHQSRRWPSPLLLHRCISSLHPSVAAWCCLCSRAPVSRAGTCASFSQVKLEPV
jgi:hypothetical protein